MVHPIIVWLDPKMGLYKIISVLFLYYLDLEKTKKNKAEKVWDPGIANNEAFDGERPFHVASVTTYQLLMSIHPMPILKQDSHFFHIAPKRSPLHKGLMNRQTWLKFLSEDSREFYTYGGLKPFFGLSSHLITLPTFFPFTP